MKILALTAFAALGVFQMEVKDNGAALGKSPVITRVESVLAYEPGFVSIYGQQLGLTMQVLVDGRAVPVIRKGATEIVIDTGPVDPGFAKLELVHPAGKVVGAIDFTPSLKAARNGNELRLRLHGGLPCFYWLDFSYRCLDTPDIVPGVYYMWWLDMTAPASGMLRAGFVPDGQPVLFSMLVPPLAGPLLQHNSVSGTGPLNIQAYCMLVENDEDYLCYTNMVTVPGFAPTW
jgi:hypothetical protein